MPVRASLANVGAQPTRVPDRPATADREAKLNSTQKILG